MAKTATPFERLWLKISKQYGLTVRFSYRLDLRASTLTAPVLLEFPGGTKGILLVTDYNLIRGSESEIAGLGYGLSCLNAPDPSPTAWDAVAEMQRDWGFDV